jgi:hypothetical protein
MSNTTPTNGSAALAIELGKTFQLIAQQMGNYLQDNIIEMAKDPASLHTFTDDQSRVLSYSNTFFSLGARLAFQNADASIAAVQEATKAINANLNSIQKTDKWINFAGAVITLGAAIVTGNFGNIVGSAEAILATFNVKIP